MVIWVTGLSGSGKTTLCSALWRMLKPEVPELVMLDGDTVRKTLDDGLGYREEDRFRQIKRMQRLAKLLSDQDLVVLVAALYSNPELLEWNRDNLPDYFEVYLEASMDVLKHRDTKGLYGANTAAAVQNVVGVDIPWQVPQSPDMVINIDHPERPEAMARRVISAIPYLAQMQT